MANVPGQVAESSTSTSTVKEASINTSNVNNASTKQGGFTTTSPGNEISIALILKEQTCNLGKNSFDRERS